MTENKNPISDYDLIINQMVINILSTMYKEHCKPEQEQILEFTERYVKENPYDAKSQSTEFDRFENERRQEINRLSNYTDVAINKKIKETLKNLTEVSESEENKRDQVKPLLLIGHPGQGLNTRFRNAANKVAAALNLEFKNNPRERDPVYPSDFVYLSVEFEPNNQKVYLQDESVKDKIQEQLKGFLERTNNASGSLVVFDELAKSDTYEKNVVLKAISEKNFNGVNLSNVYCGVSQRVIKNDEKIDMNLFSNFSVINVNELNCLTDLKPIKLKDYRRSRAEDLENKPKTPNL